MALPVIGAAVGSALLGGALGYMGQQETNSANLRIAREANQHSAKMADKQMQFQSHMSNTAWQRGVNDMKQAGINPMLAVSQGGASSPAGAMGQAHTAEMQNSMHHLGKGVSSAIDALRLDRELKATDSQIGLNTANAATAVTQATANLNSAKKAEAETAALNATLEAVQAEGKYRKDKAESDSKFLPVDQYLNRVTQGLNSAANLLPKLRINVNKSVPKPKTIKPGGKK